MSTGRRRRLKEPENYWLDFTDNVLTLHFTLPFVTPAKAQSLEVEMYDPSFFVDFSFAAKDPAQLVGAPAACKLAVLRPGEGPTQAPGSRRVLLNNPLRRGPITAHSSPTSCR